MREDSPPGAIPGPAIPTPCPITGHPFIRVYPDAIPPDLCRELLERYDREPGVHRDGLTGGGGHQPAVKRCIEVPFSHYWLDLNHKFYEALGRAVARYADNVPTFATIRDTWRLSDSNYLMQVYEPTTNLTVPNGAHGYVWHCDAMGPPTVGRVLAVLAYLNTVEEGGETAFRPWPVKIKPVGGSIAFFPPFYDYEHAGLPPISSRKAIVTTFIVWPGMPS